MLELTPLFIAADRRLGRERLQAWAGAWPMGSPVQRVLAARAAVQAPNDTALGHAASGAP